MSLYSRGHLYGLIGLIAIFHSNLSAADGDVFTRLFIPPATHLESNFSTYSSIKLEDLRSLKQIRLSREEIQNRTGSHFSRQQHDEVKDTYIGIVGDADHAREKELNNGEHGKNDEGQQKIKGEHLNRDENDGTFGQRHKTGDRIRSNRRVQLSVHNWTGNSIFRGRTMLESAQDESKSIHSLVTHRIPKVLPRWDPLEDLTDRGQENLERHFTWKSSRSAGIRWDHILGVVRRVGDYKSSSSLLKSKKINPEVKLLPARDNRSPVPSDSFPDDIHVYGSDDVPLNRNVRDKLEAVETIEDALLLRVGKNTNTNLRSWTEKKPKGDASKKERSNRSALDPLNPMNNPLLQDPDVSDSNGLSGNDKAMLKALRRTSMKTVMIESEGLRTQHGTVERSVLELSNFESSLQSKIPSINTDTGSLTNKQLRRSQGRRRKAFSDSRMWGFYPGLDSDLSFSNFLEKFLDETKCSHRIFMVWTTPPWTYTIRYQRGLESIFYFHPRACVVVFSISIDLDFFKSFMENGFRVTVMEPNLKELLAGTPADVFASFWMAWKKTRLFYLHYPELLRLAILYKYGGIYLDTDIVLLKPLILQNNTIGAERREDEILELNGAVMAFEKNSLFLLECLVEFTATYNEQLLEFNGAGLVTRVGKRMLEQKDGARRHAVGDLWIEEPHAFFPLNRFEISRLFHS
ncbi:hypothetical protein KP509_14G093400 [Ceratopteris richardii]|uniref:Alpha 1,4-glycosyltransferase domain-containing protein n=1 Tax=Ceratopteris richardii TaxID=49495 RepID=A0A8T2TAC8_CERRI|nr:hypothetical protein KP509_14G093400 [Ceratopteris richardii]